MSNTCPPCGRVVWDVEVHGALTIDHCDHTGGPTCVLTTRKNGLVEVIKKLLKTPMVNPDQILIRTALAIVDHASPAGRECPQCGRGLAVQNGVVLVHYAKNADRDPCDASYRTCLAGVLLDVPKFKAPA